MSSLRIGIYVIAAVVIPYTSMTKSDDVQNKRSYKKE